MSRAHRKEKKGLPEAVFAVCLKRIVEVRPVYMRFIFM
jgi:hypothetical protein